MGERGRGTALGDIASDLASEGTSVVPTGGRAGNSGLGDLFRDLDDEVGGFAGATIAPPKRKGPGRPAGSLNRTTLQLQRYLQARGYRDPAEFLASIVSADTRELAAALKGMPVASVGFDDAVEVLKLQRTAAAELLPYFHQRQPQQVEVKGDAPRALIIINDGGAAVGRSGMGGAMSAFDIVEDQGVSPLAGDRSHDTRSHDDD